MNYPRQERQFKIDCPGETRRPNAVGFLFSGEAGAFFFYKPCYSVMKGDCDGYKTFAKNGESHD